MSLTESNTIQKYILEILQNIDWEYLPPESIQRKETDILLEETLKQKRAPRTFFLLPPGKASLEENMRSEVSRCPTFFPPRLQQRPVLRPRFGLPL